MTQTLLGVRSAIEKEYARNKRMGVGPFQKIAKHFEVSDMNKFGKLLSVLSHINNFFYKK